ncbi:hypothetical protein M501DRAFT_229063 [Patellaria atrata CBS 101060]|uniref:F-box domain-containing protein n=1 Tax=Patellaria atrata CBS 101060 TaxID=1346257 RepID=A0A9P4S6S1_9PEZI|nr:hypothetical protein M501DRAFT_229063 [Patellaria atrata CBS 101060]
MSFLQLPAEIRQRILEKTGLIRSCPINLDRKNYLEYGQEYIPGLRSCGVCAQEARNSCEAVPIPVQLFLVCKSLRLEAMDILYGGNKFLLEHTSVFNKLEGVPMEVLKRLANVQVRLFARYREETSEHDLQLDLWFWVNLSRWYAMKVRPHVLSFNAEELDFVRESEDTFEKTSPSETTPRMTPKLLSPGDSSFPFQSLPTELQLEVLSHTGLTQKNLSTEMDARGILLDIDGRAYPLPVKCCMWCSEDQLYCSCNRGEKWWSKTCVCPQFPNSLFEISRGMRDLALHTFYSKNQFFIRAQPAGQDEDHIQNVRDTILNVKPENFRKIRKLCIDLSFAFVTRKGFQGEELKHVLSLAFERGHPSLEIKLLYYYPCRWKVFPDQMKGHFKYPKDFKRTILDFGFDRLSVVVVTRLAAHCDSYAQLDYYQSDRDDIFMWNSESQKFDNWDYLSGDTKMRTVIGNGELL